jgi:hypothetical protein
VHSPSTHARGCAITTTIGRVEFIVGLDGNRLPAQARKLAKDLERAGTRAGKDFSDGFEGTFDRRLSQMGRRMASKLGDSGRLAGNSFSNDFAGVVTGRFRRVQGELAEILSDEESFRRFAGGFDTVDEAVQRVTTDLEALRQQKYINEDGKERLVLTAEQFRAFGAEARRLGQTLKAEQKIEQDLAATQNRLRVESEGLERAWARLATVVGDGDAFRQLSDRVGGTDEAFARLREEIEDGGTAMGRTGIEIDSLVDKLDKTRDAVERDNEQLERMEHHFVRIEAGISRLGRKITQPWRMLDNDVRLVIGLIAGAADQIAAFGSAIGAGAISGLGAFTALGIGVGSIIPVFTRLNGEIDDLPPHMQDVAREFGLFKDAFGDLADEIADAAFAELGGTFSSLATSVNALTPAFRTMGRTIGTLGRDLAKNLEPGSEHLENINTLVEDSAPLFDSLMRSAGTLGGALVRAFNKANPLTEQFVGWIDTLIDRFDDFTQSSAFDDWVRNSSVIWTDFGQLLDETGRTLNNLATPSSVQNFRDFMDDLTGFMPNLGEFLNILGELNILGILANALNEFGQAMEPLAEPTLELANALGEAALVITDELGDALTGLASAVAPAVSALASIIDAVPDDAWAGMVNGAMVLAGAFVIFKGAKGIAGVASALGGVEKALGGITGVSTKAASAIGKLTLAATGFGTAIAVGLVAGEALSQAIADIGPPADVTQEKIVKAASAVSLFNAAIEDVTGKGSVELAKLQVEGLGTTLDVMRGKAEAAEGQGMVSANTLINLTELGGELSKLATTNLPEAQEAFRTLAEDTDLTRQQQIALLDAMGPYKDRLTEIAESQDIAGTSSNLLAMALGSGAANAEEQTRTLAELEGKSATTGDAIDGLADKIRNFGDATLTTRDAEREFQASLDEVTASLEENGTTLDINTEQGRANQSALDDIAKSALDFAAATYEETGSVEDATKAVDDGRKALIEQLGQFGITGKAAEDYADELGLIPEDIDTLVALLGAQEAENTLNNLARDRTSTIRVTTTGAPTSSNPFIKEAFASGGMAYGPTNALIGEAGTEAVVPLERPLSQVDPSVRELAAFAQGKMKMASGGIAGGRQVNIGAGAIVVQAAYDPRRTAYEVLDVVAQRIG